ncbi:hypothetical protein BDV93DRAFT_519310 [Ceratobasidium sp. AG-I]|nr:hypothetical protein BDV93DRAFT_519310 [Ceratobasidium sp. AG-I]
MGRKTRLSLHSCSLIQNVYLSRRAFVHEFLSEAPVRRTTAYLMASRTYLSRDEPVGPLAIAHRCRIEPKPSDAIRNSGVQSRPSACMLIRNPRAQGPHEVSWLRAYRWCMCGASGGVLGFSSVGRLTEPVNHGVSHVKVIVVSPLYLSRCHPHRHSAV